MHHYSSREALNILHSNKSYGLTAQQVDKSRIEHGANVLPAVKSVSLLRRFVAQLADLMIVILLVASLLSFVLAVIEGEGFAEPFIIVSIVLANAILGTIQQYRADKALSHLSKLAVARVVTLREGAKCDINSSDIVVGDILVLSAGSILPADCRILDSHSLKVNEASLTGEAMPQDKRDSVLPSSTTLAERSNCLYSGTSIVAGNCTAVVYSVGINTEIGTIASMISSKAVTKTPLEHRLAQLSKVIGIVCLAVCALVFGIGLYHGLSNMSPTDSLVDVFLDIFMTSVSLAVAAIPEGLPAVVTLVLARGVQRMASKNAIIKNLNAVETLGSASVICSDKTGTLTTGNMSLASVVLSDGVYTMSNITDSVRQQLAYACMCCDATIGTTSFGDPTEIAIVSSGAKLGIASANTRLYELPFDSTRKKMTVVVRAQQEYYCITKGALDNMLSGSDNATYWQQQNRHLASSGYRVLALSVRKVSANFVASSVLEQSSNITALLAISDTIKPRVVDSVSRCVSAGIKTVMITGDSLPTAVSLATTMGIYHDGDMALDGYQLSHMSDSQLDAKVKKISVYARVTPSDKLRIVQSWQRVGAVTAMTGDGVNDSPALKCADIGCAMGDKGTAVAKESADMILVDDNFATIVDAVEEGRTVYDNIKKSVFYLLSCNIGEVLSVLVALILWNVTPLGAMQLLWVNLVTDGLPSLALGLDKGQVVMDRPPNSKGFFAEGRGRSIALYGALIGTVTLVGYGMGSTISQAHGMTMAFVVLAMSQLLFALEVRCKSTLLIDGMSWTMSVALLISLLLVALVTLVPSLMTVFELVYLPRGYYLWCIVLSSMPLFMHEIAYFVKKLKGKQKTVD